MEVFVWKCANSKRKISQNLNGRLAEQQLKVKIINMEGCAKNLVHVKGESNWLKFLNKPFTCLHVYIRT